jgi:hypothetical protein
VALLELQHVRDQRISGLRRLAVASLPVWLHAHWRLPGLLAWGAFLFAGYYVVLAASLASLEHVRARRVARLVGAHGDGEPVVHVAGTLLDSLRSALWYGLAGVSLPAWLAAGLGRFLPAWLLTPLSVAFAVLLALLVLAEALALRRTASPSA